MTNEQIVAWMEARGMDVPSDKLTDPREYAPYFAPVWLPLDGLCWRWTLHFTGGTYLISGCPHAGGEVNSGAPVDRGSGCKASALTAVIEKAEARNG